MSEQQSQPTSEAIETATIGEKWGDPISEERQAELQAALDAWKKTGAEHGKRKGPFDIVGLSDEEQDRLRLTGADVFWLAEQSGRGPHDEGSDLHLEGASLVGAQLQKADLSEAQLQGANVIEAQLQGADLSGAQAQAASFYGAELQGADLSGAQLQGTDLRYAQLRGADLSNTQLNAETQLAHADLSGRVGWRTRLLRRVWPFWTADAVALGDVHWNGVGSVELTQIAAWEQVQRLGDERGVSWRSRAAAHQYVARAYRQVATQLRAQGMSGIADRFTHRALIFERRGALRRGRLVQYIGSWLLALLAGYGYQPLYTVIWYVVAIIGFAATYHAFGSGCAISSPVDIITLTRSGASCGSAHPLSWYEAVVVSLTAFHGRGFLANAFTPSDPQAGIAAAEAVLGLLIEISFIATFTQRFFGSK